MLLSIGTTSQGGVRTTPKPWRSVLHNWQGFLVTAGLSFFIAPFIVHSLGDVTYGTWVLLNSFIGYMGLMDLGVRGAVSRYVAKFHAAGEHHSASRVTSSAVIVLAASGAMVIAIATTLSVFAVPSFRIPPSLVVTAQMVVVIGGITVAVSLVSGAVEGVLIGLQRFDYCNYVFILLEIVRAISVVVTLSAGCGLLALASIQLIVAILRVIAVYIISRRLYPSLTIGRDVWDFESIRMICSFSFFAVLISAAGQISMYTDSLVIGSYLPIEFATFFAIAANLTMYGRTVVTGISYTLTPLISALQTQETEDQLGRLILRSMRLAALVILPVVFTFMIRGGTFIGLWMGPRFVGPSGNVLWILAIALWIDASLLVLHSTMVGLNQHKGLVPYYLAEAAANLSLSIWLVQRFGIEGVAWGTTLPRLAMGVFCVPWYLRRTVGIKPMSYFVNSWVRPTAAMLLFVLASFAAERWWPPSSLVMFFIQVASVYPLAVMGAIAIGLKSDERELYGRAFHSRLSGMLTTK